MRAGDPFCVAVDFDAVMKKCAVVMLTKMTLWENQHAVCFVFCDRPKSMAERFLVESIYAVLT